MNHEHLTDQELQQYAVDPNCCDSTVVEHIMACLDCRQKTFGYKKVFAGLKEMDQPYLGFNMVDLVMPALPVIPKKEKPALVVAGTWAIIVLPLAGLLIYLFNTSLSSLIKSFTPILTALFLMSVSGIMIIMLIGIYNQYKKRIDLINSL